MVDIEWSLRAHIVPRYGEYTDVVRLVYWTCTATEGVHVAKASGIETIPWPVSEVTFIDLSQIMQATREEKRALILGWAEILQPGFVSSVENGVRRKLARQTVVPAGRSETII